MKAKSANSRIRPLLVLRLLLPFLLLTGCLGSGGAATSFLAMLVLLSFLACRPILQRTGQEQFSFRALFQKSNSPFNAGSTCLSTQDYSSGFDLTQDLVTSGDGFRVDGENTGAGYDVPTAGDINGDGLSDVLISSGYNTGDGRGYVIFGKENGHANIALPAANSDGFFISGSGGGFQGTSTAISGGGDFNGDGIDDILVTSPNITYSGRGLAGITFVVPGRTTGFSDFFVSTLPSSDGFLIGGAALQHYMGRTANLGGDFNGDGISDVALGGSAYNLGEGHGYVVFGRGGTSNIDLNTITTSDGFRVQGGLAMGGAGELAVSVAGDVNGDGRTDFLIGQNGYASYAGASFIIYGTANQNNLTLSSWTSGYGTRIVGAGANQYSGTGTRSAGDINGDGFADILIGGWPYNTTDGRAWLVFGKSNLADINLGSISASDGFQINSDPGQGNRLGYGFDSAGDLNGDGFDEIVFGAPYSDVGAYTNAGQVYVLFGKAGGFADISVTGLSSSDGFSVRGANNGYNTGSSVASAGDVNGDGCGDLIIGAPGANGGNGAAYVIFGGRRQ